MNLSYMIQRAGRLLRDESNTIYSKVFLIENINEAVDRFRQIVPELQNMNYLSADLDVPNLLPVDFHHLLYVYAMARCYEIDEQHYQAAKYMNEFETKVQNLVEGIADGTIIITDSDGNVVTPDIRQDHVVNVYFKEPYYLEDTETTDVQM